MIGHFTHLFLGNALLALFCLHFAAFAQDLPDKIRGYKVQTADITVRTPDTAAANDKAIDAAVRIGDPKIISVSLTGIKFEMPIEASPIAASGIIDFLSFNDITVNGIPVEIEEYRGPIKFEKNKPFSMPQPAAAFVSSTGVIEAAWSEFRNSKKEWNVKGRVFVFGKFRKMGFKFKRVVPIDINITVKNPLK